MAGAKDPALASYFSQGEIWEHEIIKTAKARYPGVTLRYAWPFDVNALAGVLSAQILTAEASK